MKGGSSENAADRQPVGDLTCFHAWLTSLGRSKVWGWRARQQGLIQTVSICGRLYVSRRAIQEFEQRAAAGHFVKFVSQSNLSDTRVSEGNINLQSK